LPLDTRLDLAETKAIFAHEDKNPVSLTSAI
jgi:hypothetical protein